MTLTSTTGLVTELTNSTLLVWLVGSMADHETWKISLRINTYVIVRESRIPISSARFDLRRQHSPSGVAVAVATDPPI